MLPKQNVPIEGNHAEFPRREVFILLLCVSVNAYTRVNLFPYVGIMVMQLMRLQSINEAGETSDMQFMHYAQHARTHNKKQR